jgi:predicted nucleic acid-binding protein
MSFTVFADTNVILDNILNRPPAAYECKQIFSLAENGHVNLYTSHTCLLTVMYFLKKEKLPNAAVIQIIEQILKVFLLVSPDPNGMKAGLHAGFTDLEDGIQYHTALQVKNITHFITSNTKDFKKSSTLLPVVSPKEFLRLYNKA